jgi:sugar lactone lactonase YvrE
MQPSKKNLDRLITIGIISVSVIGIAYFAISAFYRGSIQEQTNPFEYNIDFYKQNDAHLNDYNEINGIKAPYQTLSAVAIGPGDRIYLAGDLAYTIYNRRLQMESSVTCGEQVTAMAVDRNEDVYLGMTNHIGIFSNEGKSTSRWTDFPEKSMITSLALTPKSAFVADAGNFVVLEYNKNGILQRRIGEKDARREIPGFIIPSPFFDLAIDPDGYLWVVDPGRLSLENYTPEGDLRSKWGEPGMDIARFCGCCNPSHIAILDEGSFVTAEKGIARVKVYNRLGQLVSVVAGPDQFTEGTVGLDLAVDSQNRIYVLDPKRRLVRIFEKKIKQGES